MRYAIAAVLLLYGLLCLFWPRRVFGALQGRTVAGMSERYRRASAVAVRLIGLFILIAAPAALWLAGSPQ